MEPQTPLPLAPDHSRQPSQQPVLPTSSGSTHTKRNLATISAVVLVAVAIAVPLALHFLNKKTHNATNRTQQSATHASQTTPKTEQFIANPADGSKVSINETDYYSLTVGTTAYYGPIAKINDAYIRMLPTAYKNQGQLTFTGANELHDPEPATFFALSSISEVHKLSDSLPDDLTIINFVKTQATESANTNLSDNIDSYLETAQLQAFFFKDGMVFFAKASTMEGNFLSGAQHVYYMNGINGQVSLTVAKPDQYAYRSGKELLYWQNLRSEGKVAKAIAVYEQHKP
ncbi:MAG TPA: hypothetical protein VLH84_02605 [Patescibacteria group bacterium]|nr:hypothetical protein [Patescibacteria group bacterium]